MPQALLLKSIEKQHDTHLACELTASFIEETEGVERVSIWLRTDEEVFACQCVSNQDSSTQYPEQFLNDIPWIKHWKNHGEFFQWHSAPSTYIRWLQNKELIDPSTRIVAEVPLRLLPAYLLGFVRIEFSGAVTLSPEELDGIEELVLTCTKSIYSSHRYHQVNLHRKAEQVALVRENREKDDALSVCVDAFISVDHDNRIFRYSESGEQLFGYTEDEIIGKKISRICSSITRTLKKRQSDNPIIYQEVGCTRKDGTGFIALVAVIPARQAYGREEIAGTTLMFRDISESVKTRRRLEKLEEDINRDPLTGVFNRRYASQWLQSHMSALEVDDHPLTVAMLDVDHFKMINDTYGHQFGDQALVQITEIISRTLRRGDMLSRYGGEEFLIALPECDVQDANAVLEKIRSRIAETPMLSEEGKVAVTVSIGFDICHRASELDSVTRRADVALYKAKNTSRNRVVYAGDNQLDMFSVTLRDE